MLNSPFVDGRFEAWIAGLTNVVKDVVVAFPDISAFIVTLSCSSLSLSVSEKVSCTRF